MGPFAGPVTSALLAALVSGLALGVVRLSHLSLAWLRRRRAPVAPAEEASIAGETTPAAPSDFPTSLFPGANVALACAATAALLVLLLAITLEPQSLRVVPDVGETLPFTRPGASSSAGVPELEALGRQLTAQLGLAFATLGAIVVLGIACAGLERGLDRVLPRLFGRAAGASDAEVGLTLADLKAGVRGLVHGTASRESFGAGLAFVLLFASTALAVHIGGALVAGLAVPGASLLFAAAFLLVPCAYAAAAERSVADDLGFLRLRASLRQWIAAPVWAFALVAILAPGVRNAPHVLAWLALVPAVLAGLPGTSPRQALVEFHVGGDAPEPAAVVRLLTGLAHRAWLGAWALFAAAGAFAGRTPLEAALIALGLLVAVVLLRALFRRVAHRMWAPWALASSLALTAIDVAWHIGAGARG